MKPVIEHKKKPLLNERLSSKFIVLNEIVIFGLFL